MQQPMMSSITPTLAEDFGLTLTPHLVDPGVLKRKGGEGSGEVVK